MRQVLHIVLLGGLLVSVASLARAQSLPTDPALVTGQLENGLRYVIRQHAHPEGRAELLLHFATGSLNETDQQRGLAHYLEHMAFNGSKSFPPGTVVSFFESLGMTFGRDQNAGTGFDRTTYKLSLPDTRPETLDKGMTFLADVQHRLLLLPKEIDDERQIIQEERRQSLSGRQRNEFYVLERMAPGSTFGQRIPIGTKETIDSLKQSDFLDYYGKWYVASNATLLAVADVGPKAMISAIKKSFGSAPSHPKPEPRDIGVKAYDKSFAIVASDPEESTEQIRIVRLEPARPPVTTVPQYRDELVAGIGTLAFNRRLVDKVSAGGTSYLSGSVSQGTQLGAIYTADFYGRAKPGKWQQALKELALELQRARLFGFTDREISDAKKLYLTSAQRDVETEATTPASSLIRRMDRSLTAREPMMSASQGLQFIEQLLPTLTTAEIGGRFAEEFDPTNVATIAILPSSSSVPTEPELLDIATKALAVKPQREVDSARATELMDQTPEPGEISELTEHVASGVWSGWLSNNVRFHYRFMDAREDQVAVSISLLGGQLHETAENRGVTQMATVGWARPATNRLTSADIRSLMTGKNVNVRMGGGGSGRRRARGSGGGSADSIALSVSGSPEDLEFGMQLAHLLLTEPKVEAAAFRQYATRLRTALKQADLDPLMAGMRAMAGAPYPTDVARTQPITMQQLEQIDVAAAQVCLMRAVQSSPIEVAVVGDLPKDRAMQLIARYIGSLPKRERVSEQLFAKLRQLSRPDSPTVIAKEIPTETKKAFVFSSFYAADANNLQDTRALRLGTKILSTRMVRQIREEEQLVYSIGASFRPGTTYPGFGMVATAAPTDPGKADRLLTKIASMYEALARDGVSKEELAVAKKQRANTLDRDMREPGFWLSRLSMLTYRGTKLDAVMQDPDAYQAITADQIRTAFARYYQPDRLVKVVVTPVE